jgi:hypothetical protein
LFKIQAIPLPREIEASFSAVVVVVVVVKMIQLHRAALGLGIIPKIDSIKS